MAYLLYGIVKDPVVGGTSIAGVKGQPVIFVEAHGLCAAVSELDVEKGAPPVEELLAYAQVVEALHRRQAVVPMRYGCFLNGIPAIQDILKARRRQYEILLAELAGHVEMGIRILLPEKEGINSTPEVTTLPEAEATFHSDALFTTDPEKEPPPPGGLQPAAGGSKGLVEQVDRQGNKPSRKEVPAINGRAYLALRKVHYRMQEETSQSRQALIDRYIHAFSGLYTRHRAETDVKKDTVILSLYFLTPESAVNRFREAFGEMMVQENDEALLSGPWPPYNFVTTEIAPPK
ncbi:MAG: GvpL/GvpF family gas vesicle protein [Syntrophales bacterium]|jgi:hypothetical protein|nr:GvpL/GvpF family gas vesicle protein [Syntrophales bacterium]MCK9390973.1 GvpL/GvpF family gas vesicle protein [Syntrophales bacterium]